MMRYIPLCLFVVLFLSNCRQQEKPSFDSIELSYHNGGSRTTSVYLDSSKKVHIAIQEFRKHEKRYEGVMKDSAFIWLNSRVNWFFTNKHPSVVGKPIPDCSIAFLLIRSAHAEKQIMMYHDPELGKLDSIIHCLIDLNAYDHKLSGDTGFYFISREKIRLPPVVSESRLFIPPGTEKTTTDTMKHRRKASDH